MKTEERVANLDLGSPVFLEECTAIAAEIVERASADPLAVDYYWLHRAKALLTGLLIGEALAARRETRPATLDGVFGPLRVGYHDGLLSHIHDILALTDAAERFPSRAIAALYLRPFTADTRETLTAFQTTRVLIDRYVVINNLGRYGFDIGGSKGS